MHVLKGKKKEFYLNKKKMCFNFQTLQLLHMDLCGPS